MKVRRAKAAAARMSILAHAQGTADTVAFALEKASAVISTKVGMFCDRPSHLSLRLRQHWQPDRVRSVLNLPKNFLRGAVPGGRMFFFARGEPVDIANPP